MKNFSLSLSLSLSNLWFFTDSRFPGIRALGLENTAEGENERQSDLLEKQTLPSDSDSADARALSRREIVKGKRARFRVEKKAKLKQETESLPQKMVSGVSVRRKSGVSQSRAEQAAEKDLAAPPPLTMAALLQTGAVKVNCVSLAWL